MVENNKEEIKETVSDDKSKQKVFITNVTSKHVTVFDKQYTYPQFEYLLKFMSRGMFMYPDELLDLDKPEDEQKTKGFVIVKGIVEIKSTRDNAYVLATKDYKKAWKQVKYIGGSHAVPEIANKIYNITESLNYINNDNKQEVINYINDIFEKYRKKYVCYRCGLISANAKTLILNAQQKNEHKECFCRGCSKDLLSKNTITRDKKVGRNESCPCNSGRKYKHCCINKKD